MAAVDLSRQCCGIGAALVGFVLAWMKAGMAVMMFETVVLANACESLGFQLFPTAGY